MLSENTAKMKHFIYFRTENPKETSTYSTTKKIIRQAMVPWRGGGFFQSKVCHLWKHRAKGIKHRSEIA
jgi:hypothetical protein